MGLQLKCQEGTTLPLRRDYGGHERDRLSIAGQAEGVPIRDFLDLGDSGTKPGKERGLTLA